MTVGTGIASPVPILQFFNNAGQPNAGGTILTQVGGVNQATYQDSGLATPLPNPIPLNSRGEISNASGTSCQLFLPPNTVYVFTLYDANGNQINQASYVTAVAPTAQSVGQLIWPQTPQELAASVTPTYYYFPPGDWRRYGADPTGVADSTAAINAANSANDCSYDGIGGTYICSGTLGLISNQTMKGLGSGTVLSFGTNSGINQILMSGLSHAIIRDLKITCTGSATAQVAGIYIVNSSYCIVENVELSGMTAAGVTLDCSNYCKIQENVVESSVTSTNYADIQIYNQFSATAGSTGNEILNNVCNGTNSEFGIAVWDGYFATTPGGFPTYNLVEGNAVGAHTGYGLLCYLPGSAGTPPGACNTFNRFVNNVVTGITGTVSGNNESGAGVYCVGSGIGGTEVTGNTIYNCCTGTASAGLAPSGIGVNGVSTGLVRPLIHGNRIGGMTQGDGIVIVSSPGGAVVSDNVINMPSSNNGSGAGGSGLIGSGIHIFNSSLVTLGPNDVQAYGSGSALSLYASSGNVSNVTVTGGNYEQGGAGYALQTAQAGGNNITYLTVNGANFISTGSTDAVNINAIIQGSFTGVICQAASGRGLYVNGNQWTKFAGGMIVSGGATALGTAGTCTGSFIDKSVGIGQGATSQVANAATGMTIETRGTAAPTTGTWAVGDHVQNTAPAAGGVPGWYCTTAGTPGTWKAEASVSS